MRRDLPEVTNSPFQSSNRIRLLRVPPGLTFNASPAFGSGGFVLSLVQAYHGLAPSALLLQALTTLFSLPGMPFQIQVKRWPLLQPTPPPQTNLITLTRLCDSVFPLGFRVCQLLVNAGLSCWRGSSLGFHLGVPRPALGTE